MFASVLGDVFVLTMFVFFLTTVSDIEGVTTFCNEGMVIAIPD